MIKVALTGNFHSGQDEVSDIFESLNVKVFDADLILKYLINYSSDHIQKIQNEFGKESHKFGLLNMQLFRSKHNWDRLIDLLEFDLLKSYEKFRFDNKNDYYIMFKYSFLLERNLQSTFDHVIGCYKSKHLRQEDLKLNTFLSDYTIYNILNNELDEDYKKSKYDYLIDTSDKFGIDQKVKNVNTLILKNKPQDIFNTLGSDRILVD